MVNVKRIAQRHLNKMSSDWHVATAEEYYSPPFGLRGEFTINTHPYFNPNYDHVVLSGSAKGSPLVALYEFDVPVGDNIDKIRQGVKNYLCKLATTILRGKWTTNKRNERYSLPFGQSDEFTITVKPKNDSMSTVVLFLSSEEGRRGVLHSYDIPTTTESKVIKKQLSNYFLNAARSVP